MERREVVRALLEHSQNEIVHLPKKYIRELAPAMADVHQELRSGLQWLAEHEGAASFTAQSRRNALIQLEGAFEAIEKMYPEMVHTLKAGKEAAGVLANKHLESDFIKFANIFGYEAKPIDFQVAGHIATGVTKTAKLFTNAMSKKIRIGLTRGVLAGESFAQVSKRINGYASPGAKLGQTFNYWAERIVRTELMDAYNYQAKEDIKDLHSEDDQVLQYWNGTMDARTCMICADLDGTTAAPGKLFPGGYEDPPAHPNCRCILTAWKSEWRL